MEDLLACVETLVSCSWNFLTGVNVPGLEISFAALFVGLFLASLGLRLLFMLLGIGKRKDDDD